MPNNLWDGWLVGQNRKGEKTKQGHKSISDELSEIDRIDDGKHTKTASYDNRNNQNKERWRKMMAHQTGDSSSNNKSAHC